MSFVTEAAHDVVRYSQVWEDHALLERGLRVGPGDDVLSIASAGCNVLALLLAGPRSIVAVDVSPSQLALVELKLAALRTLDHAGFAALLGATPGDRDALYARARRALPLEARAYWDAHPDDLRAGVLHRGLLDRYIAAFVERHVPFDALALLEAGDLGTQSAIFDREVAALEPAVREWFGREGLSGRARDASQFRHVDAGRDVAGTFWARFEHVCRNVPAYENFYLEYLLTGRYRSLATGPTYLRPEHFDALRAAADRVTLVEGRLEDALDGRTFDAANLSNLFEYLDAADADALHGAVAAALNPGGRVAYWNLFVERRGSALQPVPGDLLAGDRVPFYGAFHVEVAA